MGLSESASGEANDDLDALWDSFDFDDLPQAIRILQILVEAGDPLAEHYLGEAHWMSGNVVDAELSWARNALRCSQMSFEKLQNIYSLREKLGPYRQAIADADEYSSLVDPSLRFVISELEKQSP